MAFARFPWVAVISVLFSSVVHGNNSDELWFTQLTDHFSTSTASWEQRYYQNDTFFKGPGHPIFCIMGGEGGIPPDEGLYYPFVYEVMAAKYGALTIEPEHRFYGQSLPFGNQSFSRENLQLLNPQQAIADTARLIQAIQAKYNCTKRYTSGYCPVITVGGSYPGFLSAMMRVRYPSLVDIGYAASAPLRFWSQDVDHFAYYEIITNSAQRALPSCPAAVRAALSTVLSTPMDTIVQELNLCTPLPAYMDTPDAFLTAVMMLIRVQFANDNMENYPPDNQTALYQSCSAFVSNPDNPWIGLRTLLGVSGLPYGKRAIPARLRLALMKRKANGLESVCYSVQSQIPDAGDGVGAGTVSCGDWSGCGGGRDGESWDYETCSYMVSAIGTNNVTDMFPPRSWSIEWMEQHCSARFGLTPAPRRLADLWGFDQLVNIGASHIIFTNGLNDGWSAGGYLNSLSSTLVAFNMPNGAHHSDLSHHPASPSDTPDVVATRDAVDKLIGEWLMELQQNPA